LRERVGVFSNLPPLLRQFDVEPRGLVAQAGLPPDALDDADNRLPYEALLALLASATARTGCRHFGLLLGRAAQGACMGPIWPLVRNAPTLGAALRILCTHRQLDGEGGSVFLVEHGRTADLGYAIYRRSTRARDQMNDLALAHLLCVMRELRDPYWTPDEVLLPHSAPRDERPFRTVFRVRPHYDADICALRFPAALLEKAIADADTARFSAAATEVATVDQAALVPKVHRALRMLLLEGKSGGDDVAHTLAMHRRTFNRRLKAEGTTFQRLLDDVRFDLACQLLESTTLPIVDIGFALGYESAASFMRSFRRWSGTSPGAWRRACAAGHEPDR
jgi:AraC-like DNA-binding protein